MTPALSATLEISLWLKGLPRINKVYYYYYYYYRRKALI